MKRLALPAVFTFLTACSAQSQPPLPALKLDPQRVAVAGFSSGAAMAQQVHLAYSDHLIGAALLAGPPYHCAEGKLELALGRCIKAQPDAPDAKSLAAVVRERAGKQQLAPLSGLAGDRVLVLRGQGDALVAEPVPQAAHALYAELGNDAAQYDGSGDFAHVFPTLAAGGECGLAASPYLGNCGIDTAGRMMEAMFGDASGEPVAAVGQLVPFAQGTFADKERDALLGDTGYLYVPPACATGERCGLLIAFHGCEQNADAVGDSFARDAGFNRWADAQGVVVLYPQTRSSYVPLNPKACWDWWGYTGADYDTRDGAQVAWVANVAAALGVPLR